jgi:hypothetical protein
MLSYFPPTFPAIPSLISCAVQRAAPPTQRTKSSGRGLNLCGDRDGEFTIIKLVLGLIDLLRAVALAVLA